MSSSPANKSVRRPFNRAVDESDRCDGSTGDSQPLREGKDVEQNGNVLPDAFVEFINYGLEDQMEIKGFVRDRVRTFTTWILIVITFGTLRLVFHWWPRLMLYCTHRPCSLEMAEKVLITECYQKKHKRYYVKDVKTITSLSARDELKDDEQDVWDQHFLLDLDNLDTCKLSVHVSGGTFKSREEVRTFNCKKMIYVWDPDEFVFHKLRGLDWDVTASALHQAKGLSMVQQYFRRAVCGRNEIIIPLRSVVALLFLEVLNPFYIFQIFSFTLWTIDDYIYYAFAIALMSCTSIVFAVIQTRKNQLNLSSRVHSSDVANVLRAGSNDTSEVVTVPTNHLVPGDLLVIPKHGCIMHCDAVLLTGNCIVNESMLTGESVPVTKTPMPNTSNVVYSEKEHARHTLFCGTQVIQTRYYGHESVYAVVIRTGFSTAKGNLVRSILYPPPVDFKFEQDSYKFVQLLAAFAVLGVVYTYITKSIRHHPFSQILLEALDLVTIVVPPALPAAMTVGRMYAQGRLEKSSIFCISPRTINVSGSINCVCFDKTGTLTEDGLDMWGAIPVSESKFQLAERVMRALKVDHLLKAMVTCHSITIIDGSLAGDPLDIKMFESTGWSLEEPEVSDDAKFDLICPTIVKPPHSTVTPETIDGLDFEIGIIRQFPFSSSLQRMSVITRILGAKKFTLYCKGSPEMVRSLCDPETVPTDFDLELEGYTKEGYRVLGVAYRELPVKLSYAKMQRLSREEAESELTFLGFVIMENRLKPQTSGVLAMLRDAKIRTVMVTGDNMLTALSVARDCGIVPQGKRVIMVHTTDGPGKPDVYFTQSKSGNHLDTAHILSEASQITATLSLTSLQTVNSNRVGNGTARNSGFSDLPVDICLSENGMDKNEYSFALTGSTWTALRDHHPDLKDRIVSRGVVFARMSPDHKQQLIQDLQSLNYFVAMVGDGANDCGALKAAHAGISLSEAESSVASPFTSKIPNISCIVQVIREGRAALVTSFAIFKYMAAYSLMQFASVIILYSIDSNLTDIEYLYIDLFVITTFAFVLGRAEAFNGPLFPEPPESSLMATTPICSLLGHMILAVATQMLSFTVVGLYEERYEIPEHNTTLIANDSLNATNVEAVGSGLENYAVFAVSSLQYIILALVFSKGTPYRKPLFLTPNLMAAVILITSFTLYLIIDPCSFLIYHFELTLPSSIEFRLLMIALGMGNAALSFAYESLCDFFQSVSRSRRKQLLPHEELEKIMSECTTWPPITTESPPIINSPTQSRPSFPPSKVTVVNSPPGNKTRNHSLGMNSVSDLQLEELKFSTPMRSVLSLNTQRQNNWANGQSEDSLSGYLTPPTSLESTPQHAPSGPKQFF